MSVAAELRWGRQILFDAVGQKSFRHVIAQDCAALRHMASYLALRARLRQLSLGLRYICSLSRGQSRVLEVEITAQLTPHGTLTHARPLEIRRMACVEALQWNFIPVVRLLDAAC